MKLSSRMRMSVLALVLPGLVALSLPAPAGKLPLQVPAITLHPTPQATILGGQAIFAVIASGTAPFEYRWRKDGVDLVNGPGVDGATRDALILTDVGFDDAGDYGVVITNVFGSATSVDVPLTVGLPAGGDLDFSFDSGSSIDSAVYDFAVQPDGKILIGGFFNSLKDVPRNKIARLHPDGSTDHTFGYGLEGANGSILTLALQTDGRVLIGGYFTAVNGVSRNRIARLHPDGSLDTTFLDGLTGVDGVVEAIALQPGGRVLIGGAFTTVNGVSRNNLARLNADGSLDTGFMHGLAGTDWPVYSIAAHPDGHVWIGGDFTTVNGQRRNHFARLKRNGSLPLGDRFLAGADARVGSIVVQPDGRVLIGGIFGTVHGASRNRIARLEANGRLDTTFLDGLDGTTASVRSIALLPDGRVLFAGFVDKNDGEYRKWVARLNADGSLDTSYLDGLSGPVGQVTAIHLQPDGRLLTGGWFDSVNDVNRDHLARLEADGGLDHGFQTGVYGVGGALSSARQADGRVVIGGIFTKIQGTNRNHVARLNADGSLDTTFLDGLEGPDRYLRAVALQPDGRVLIGGEFDTVNGVSRSHFARLEADGSLDTSFMDGLSGPNKSVRAIVVQSDGRLLIGGSFWDVSGVRREHIARLNADGTLDATFTRPHVETRVNAVGLQPDGKILIGGHFRYVGTVPRNKIARLNADGSLDTSFQSGLDEFGVEYAVYALALQEDGRLLIGGSFNTIDGVARNKLARLNADGSLDATFDSPLDDLSYRVYAIAVQPDGRILVGGDFTVSDGASRRDGFARLEADGSLDLTFQEGLAPVDGYTASIEVLGDSRVLATGGFSTVRGRAGVVLVYGDVTVPPAR